MSGEYLVVVVLSTMPDFSAARSVSATTASCGKSVGCRMCHLRSTVGAKVAKITPTSGSLHHRFWAPQGAEWDILYHRSALTQQQTFTFHINAVKGEERGK